MRIYQFDNHFSADPGEIPDGLEYWVYIPTIGYVREVENPARQRWELLRQNGEYNGRPCFRILGWHSWHPKMADPEFRAFVWDTMLKKLSRLLIEPGKESRP